MVDRLSTGFATPRETRFLSVIGPSGSGKSCVVQCLVDSLCVTPRGMSRNSSRTKVSDIAETSHKLQKIYPLVVDDLDSVFGCVNQNGDWVDGVFTSAWRKAARVNITWNIIHVQWL